MSLLKILSKIASNVPGKKKMIFHMASNRSGFHIRLFTAMSSKFQSPKEYSLSFTNSSKKSLYLTPVEQRHLYLILYTTKIYIRYVFCSIFLYVCICHSIKCHIHVLILLNSLSRP
jgi:hypothetical protein